MTIKSHEKWKAHKPHKGDVIYRLNGEQLGIVSHVENAICWLQGGNCFIWCFREELNNQHTWNRKEG